jgi:membrane protein implicated in regulation of membrane protease activity
VEKKWFWLIFIVLSLIADFVLPLVWSMIMTLPILVFSWWLVYKSGIFY